MLLGEAEQAGDLFSSYQVYVIRVVMVVFSSLSVLGCLFIIFTFIIFKKLRTRTSMVIFHLSLADLGGAFAFILSIFLPYTPYDPIRFVSVHSSIQKNLFIALKPQIRHLLHYSRLFDPILPHVLLSLDFYYCALCLCVHSEEGDEANSQHFQFRLRFCQLCYSLPLCYEYAPRRWVLVFRCRGLRSSSLNITRKMTFFSFSTSK